MQAKDEAKGMVDIKQERGKKQKKKTKKKKNRQRQKKKKKKSRVRRKQLHNLSNINKYRRTVTYFHKNDIYQMKTFPHTMKSLFLMVYSKPKKIEPPPPHVPLKKYLKIQGIEKKIFFFFFFFLKYITWLILIQMTSNFNSVCRNNLFCLMLFLPFLGMKMLFTGQEKVWFGLVWFLCLMAYQPM